MTTMDPEPENLPEKPTITDPMPSDEELERMPEPGDENLPEEKFMQPEVAHVDDTVDDQEDDSAA